MPRYESQCKTCGTEAVITSSYDDREKQRCACGGELEYLISETHKTRFGFGFQPALVNSKTGERVTEGARRPATVKRS